MCLFYDRKPIIRRDVCVETKGNGESWLRAVNPYAVSTGEKGAQSIASSRDAKTVPLRDSWAYDEGLLGQQLGLRKPVLAFVFLLPATCWERHTLAAAPVFLVVMV